MLYKCHSLKVNFGFKKGPLKLKPIKVKDMGLFFLGILGIVS